MFKTTIALRPMESNNSNLYWNRFRHQSTSNLLNVFTPTVQIKTESQLHVQIYASTC